MKKFLQLMASSKPSYVGDAFVDSNGFHLLAPSTLSDGDTMEWEQVVDYDKYPTSYTANGVTFTRVGAAVTVNGTPTATTWGPSMNNYVTLYKGSKYMFALSSLSNEAVFLQAYSDKTSETNAGANAFLSRDSRTGICNYTSVTPGTNLWAFRVRAASGYTDNNVILRTLLYNLTAMRLESINNPNVFAQTFGYNDIDSMPDFAPSENGTLVAWRGKLYYKI